MPPLKPISLKDLIRYLKQCGFEGPYPGGKHQRIGNTDDRQPVLKLLNGLTGKVLADRGYVSQSLFETLLTQMGIQLITKPKRNMKNKLMPLMDKLLLRRRSIIETIIDQLKNISQIEHSRHRSPVNCIVNLICGLIAYCHQPKKPSLNINEFFLPSA
jgi:hypothetical protein